MALIIFYLIFSSPFIMTTLSLLYITMPTLDAAQCLATILLDKSYIACANMLPITSMYRWEGKIAQDSEILLLVKTKNEFVEIVKKEIVLSHPYAVPCILTFSAQANEPFYAWLCSQVQNT